MRDLITYVLLWLGLGAAAAQCHEFWISPERYHVAPGEEIRGDLRVGQEFKGVTLMYAPGHFARFDLVQAGATQAVPGRLGDTPALAGISGDAGLAVVVHETSDREVTYREWQTFLSFLEDKDLMPADETHLERGLPTSGFRESYRRFAKALLAVGDGAGEDRRVGLDFEIVAEANPYVDEVGDGMPLRVFLGGAPRVDAQVELFERATDGTVTRSLHRTDADGRLRVPARAGGEYLANSTVLRPLSNDDPDAGPVWHSDWASLTYRIPEP